MDLKIDASEVQESLAELLNIAVSFAAEAGMWIMHMSGCNQIVCAYLLRCVLHVGGKVTSLLHLCNFTYDVPLCLCKTTCSWTSAMYGVLVCECIPARVCALLSGSLCKFCVISL